MTRRHLASVFAFAAVSLTSAYALAAPLVIDGTIANACPGGTVIAKGCSYSGTQTFDYVEVKNGGVLSVKQYAGGDTSLTGNLVLIATGLDPTSKFSIHVDESSRITAKGAGFQGLLCDNGTGPVAFPASGGRGGCALDDSGGGGAHFGNGGRGTKDNPVTFPNDFEEDCGSTLNAAKTACGNYASCKNGDGLPTVAGQEFYHSIYDPLFGAAGGDKGCRDGDGFSDGSGLTTLRAGGGGGRIVLFAANAAQTGIIWIEGRVAADGNRGCGQGNDSAGGGAGGTILIVSDEVTVAKTARISSHGGHGGDEQIKCLPCTTNADCVSVNGAAANATGQLCQMITDPQTGIPYGRCAPCNCTPCTTNAQCNADLGQTCKAVAGAPGNVCADASNSCTPFDPGDNEVECKFTQNQGTCDDCGGGGGGGLINVQSRLATFAPEAIFDVRGSVGGVCPVCTGEAGGGIGELQLDSGYAGEICDGFDNDFNGMIDDGLPILTCAGGVMLPSCKNGLPQVCPVDPATCTVPATDSRPRFSMIVDTSGSMLDDVSGNPLFGDGSVEFPGVMTANSPKLFIAKNAVSSVIAAFPENGYSLARYYQDVGINRSCQTAANFECALNCCSYDNPIDNTPPIYPTTYPGNECVLNKLYPGAGYPNTATFKTDISIGWPTPTNDCINYAGNCGPPRRGSQVLVGFDQPLSRYLKWLDNTETNFKETPMDVDGSRCLNGDCELRATGGTPLASALQATEDYLSPIITCDGAKACRKYATILLTDGAESCQGDPAAAAKDMLMTLGVKTYVIGFSVLPTEKVQLDAIATAGGTNAAQFTGGTDAAFFATSENQLADAIASIISSSQVFEKCNGIDDNCNNLIDEGFNVGAACDNGKLGTCKVTGAFACSADGSTTVCSAAGAAGTPPSMEVCNGLDDDCNGLIDDGINCQVCIPSPEVCNGKDDDCDGNIDNMPIDVGKMCGSSIGVCKPGLTACKMGKLECDGGVQPSPEICDGLDNDCDGVVDGNTQACYDGPMGTSGVGVCHPGLQKCNAMSGGGASYGPCIGEVIPSAEVCDGLDNDCNGKVDDGVGDGMGHTTGEACCAFGDKCGVGVCKDGAYQCVGNAVQCAGGTGPSIEICDNLDNDCNGKTDDIPGLGTTCVQATGCGGLLACDTMTKKVVCSSPTTPMKEICNGIDDNCNGMIDEEPDVMNNDPRIDKPCEAPTAPSDHPPCKAGTTVCTNGAVVCQGAVTPLPEICDNTDNDCDGKVDTGAPCPSGSSCVMGQCETPCKTGEFPCPGGFTCVAGSCISASCAAVTCMTGTVCMSGKCVSSGAGGGGGSGGSSASGGSSGSGGSSAAGHAGTSASGGSGGTSHAGSGGVAGNSAGGNTAGGAGGKAGSSASVGGASSQGGSSVGNGGSGGVAGSGVATTGTGGGEGQNADANFGLATGGGGCACRATPADGRSGAAGVLAMAAGILALKRRKRARAENGQGGAR